VEGGGKTADEKHFTASDKELLNDSAFGHGRCADTIHRRLGELWNRLIREGGGTTALTLHTRKGLWLWGDNLVNFYVGRTQTVRTKIHADAGLVFLVDFSNLPP